MKKILILSVATLLTASCTQSEGQADGYKWNNYKGEAASKPTGDWNDKYVDNDLKKSVDTHSIIKGVSADMVETLEPSLSRTTPIYLSPANKLNATTSLFDDALRQDLKDAGYTLSSTKNKSYLLSYDIKKSASKQAPKAYDFVIMGMGQEAWVVLEQRTQELPKK